MSARLKTGGVSVSYHHVPCPGVSDYSGDSLRRSDTSSATLPVTWSCSSLDRNLETSSSSSSSSSSSDTSSSSQFSDMMSPGVSQDSVTSSPPGVSQGPVILIGDDFDPQVMTEDQHQPGDYSSTSHGSSSSSGSMFYATFIPDSSLDSDEVSIVCNGYTQIDTEVPNNYTKDNTQVEKSSDDTKKEIIIKKKNWKSNIKLPKLVDFWEQRNRDNQFRKYASESNIFSEELPENGLRKILKDNHFTSCEDSITEEDDDEKVYSDYSVRSGYEHHVYEVIPNVKKNTEESGFYSFENRAPKKTVLQDIESSDNHSDEHVTIIAVDYNTNNNSKSVKNLIKIFEPEDQVRMSFII